MALSPAEAVEVASEESKQYPHLREKLDRLDKWWRWDHDKPHQPSRQATAEYKELMARSMTPWLGLVVTAVAQTLEVEGYSGDTAEAKEWDAAVWRWWQANRLDSRQSAVHEEALAYGYSYVRVANGKNLLTGAPEPIIRGVSPRRMIASYRDVVVDDFPVYALEYDFKPLKHPDTGITARGLELRIWDNQNEHVLHRFDKDGKFIHVADSLHGASVCPVVKFANKPDNEGRTPGEVEPFISVAARIDQTTFDRLVVQRFSSWVVRTIAGMSSPDTEEGETAARLRLRVEDLLIADDPDTKFGSLPATPLDGFIRAKEADVRDLAAVSQTPPNHLLGEMVNLSAEALAAGEASRERKSSKRKTSFGESWELVFRLSASMMGVSEVATDVGGQVRWADIESRSLAQAADALGKLSTMLGIPPEGLWPRVPGTTDQELAEWRRLRDEADELGALFGGLVGSTTPPAAELPA